MKKTILLTLFVASLFDLRAQSQIVNSWRDPNTTIQNPGIHKIVVAALLNDPVVRRQVEDYMASLYPGLATPSYIVFGTEPLGPDEEVYNQTLKSQGYDGIVLLRQTNENVSQHYIPGHFPAYYNSWGGYWRNGWGRVYYAPGAPGHEATDRTWIVQVTAYSVEANKLIWAANTSTTDPGGRLQLFKDVCNAARNRMRSDGFLN